jgi:hypothetical protein
VNATFASLEEPVGSYLSSEMGGNICYPFKFLKKRNDSLSQNVQASGQGDLNEGDLSDS